LKDVLEAKVGREGGEGRERRRGRKTKRYTKREGIQQSTITEDPSQKYFWMFFPK
jgi:hypothetical protein